METLRILSAGSHLLSPVTELVRSNGSLLARKRYPRPGPIASFLLNHEVSILQALSGIPGIPRLVEYVPGRRFAIEFIEGRHVHEIAPDRLDAAVFERLVSLVNRMHARRVAHLDLRQRKNILIDDAGIPTLIDFQTSVRFPQNAMFEGPLELCRWVDRSALRRWKNRFFPSLMTDADRAAIRLHTRLRPFWVVSPFKKRQRDLV